MDLGTENDKQPAHNKVIRYFGIIMALAYVAFGVVIIFGSKEAFKISTQYAIPFGCLLIIYGLFRAYRIYQKLIEE